MLVRTANGKLSVRRDESVGCPSAIQSCGMRQSFAMPRIDVGSKTKTAKTSLKATVADAVATSIDSQGIVLPTVSSMENTFVSREGVLEDSLHHDTNTNLEPFGSHRTFNGILQTTKSRSNALVLHWSKLAHGNADIRQTLDTTESCQFIAVTLNFHAAIMARAPLKLSVPIDIFSDEKRVCPPVPCAYVQQRFFACDASRVYWSHDVVSIH